MASAILSLYKLTFVVSIHNTDNTYMGYGMCFVQSLISG